MMYIKFHRSYSVYFGSWASLPYANDDNGDTIILDHENMEQLVYFIIGF